MLKRVISTLTIGEDFSKRIYLQLNRKNISPWHSIPLYTNDSKFILPSVIEIPRDAKAKFEVSLKEEFNPLKQDTKKNRETGKVELRYYAKYPLFNYGMLPQTWENPFVKDHKHQLFGDGDPLDTLDLGNPVVESGALIQVKILGSLCLVDQGELDWKILCINTADPIHTHINDPTELETHFPGRLQAIIDWLENIKVFEGKPKNRVIGPPVPPTETLKIIESAHSDYQDLINHKYPEANAWLANS